MADLDTIILRNPTNEDFVQRYNGQPYTLPASATKAFAQYVGFHIAKHLASRMVEDEMPKKLKESKSPVVSQRLIYDNPHLRIALYKILRDKELVQQVVTAYPYKGFVGEMSEYERFVLEEEKKPLSEVEGVATLETTDSTKRRGRPKKVDEVQPS